MSSISTQPSSHFSWYISQIQWINKKIKTNKISKWQQNNIPKEQQDQDTENVKSVCVGQLHMELWPAGVFFFYLPMVILMKETDFLLYYQVSIANIFLARGKILYMLLVPCVGFFFWSELVRVLCEFIHMCISSFVKYNHTQSPTLALTFFLSPFLCRSLELWREMFDEYRD